MVPRAGGRCGEARMAARGGALGDESGPGIPAVEVYAELDRIIAEYAAVPQ